MKAGEDSRWIKWGRAVVKLATPTDGDSLNLKQATDIGSCQEVWLKGAARKGCRRTMWQVQVQEVQVQEKVQEG